jgi:hypothetical protein
MRLITRWGAGNAALGCRTAPACLALRCGQQRLLVAVPEGRGVEIALLAVKDVLGELAHLGRNGQLRQVAEVIPGVADLIGVAQRGAEEPLLIEPPAR